MFAGHPTSPTCVQGFENAGWLLGCSGNSITDPALLIAISTNLSATEDAALYSVASLIPDAVLDSGVVRTLTHGSEMRATLIALSGQ